MRKPSPGFEGWYLKHANATDTVALIPGKAGEEAFIQVIVDRVSSWYVPYDATLYRCDASGITVGESRFSLEGARVNIRAEGLRASGTIRYREITPLRADIMGPFRYLPMQCRHAVHSLHHALEGALDINGRRYDFSGGVGYIEGDRGRAFPKRYAWLQSNDFPEKCSVMLAVADVPFLGFTFRGVLCVVWYRGVEYRLATYNGAKVAAFSRYGITVRRGKQRLEVEPHPTDGGHALLAPVCGGMSRTIHEVPACPVRFRFFGEDGALIFDMESPRAGFEFVE